MPDPHGSRATGQGNSVNRQYRSFTQMAHLGSNAFGQNSDTSRPRSSSDRSTGLSPSLRSPSEQANSQFSREDARRSPYGSGPGSQEGRPEAGPGSVDSRVTSGSGSHGGNLSPSDPNARFQLQSRQLGSNFQSPENEFRGEYGSYGLEEQRFLEGQDRDLSR